MTWLELWMEIGRLSDVDKSRPAVVYPPEGCPSKEYVPITELGVSMGTNVNHPVILTGKNPSPG